MCRKKIYMIFIPQMKNEVVQDFMKMAGEPPKADQKRIVSVIVPAFNVENYIEECIRSILRQTYRNMEIIIIDDGSTDATVQICEKLAETDERIILIKQERQGVVSARQKGIDSATGDYISFVDADDWIEPEMIADMICKIGTADMVSVGVYIEGEDHVYKKRNDGFEFRSYRGQEDMGQILRRMIYDENNTVLHPLSTWLCNKLFCADKVKVLHPLIDRALSFSEDAFFVYMYMLRVKEVVFVEKCYYHYRYRADSAIHHTDKGRLSQIGRIYESLYELFLKQDPAYGLNEQLDKWLYIRCYFALNERMGLNHSLHFFRYLADLRGLDKKRIVLYGAGLVGRHIYRQLTELSYCVALWADRRYIELKEKGYPVSAPEDILHSKYDVILIAIEDKKTGERIKSDLVAMGIVSAVIEYVKYRRLF